MPVGTVTVVEAGMPPPDVVVKLPTDEAIQPAVDTGLVERHLLYDVLGAYPDPDSVVEVAIGPDVGFTVRAAVVTEKAADEVSPDVW